MRNARPPGVIAQILASDAGRDSLFFKYFSFVAFLGGTFSLRRGLSSWVRQISDEVIVRCSYENVAEIVDAHADALLLYARQWSKVSAEDVVQEAFLRLVRRVKTNDPPENVVAWLYCVIRNELITLHHKKQNSRGREEVLASERPMWFEPSVDTRLDASRAAEQLKILPIEQRETVVARIWGELSFEEIASLTKSSRSTVHRRYVSGLETLRKSLS